MSVSAELLAVLACPSADHAPLSLVSTDGRDELLCTNCLSRFPISDGIPVLLADEATPGPRGLGVAASDASTEPNPHLGAPAAGDAAQNGSV